ncbi:MAG: PAS domain S-box protein, partial [Desulfobacterales bacterium]|nr:PAS domain S-box protein [Desulfobacterales bacterium]
ALKRAEQKLEIKGRLKAYTHDLESMIKAATEELRRRYEFEDKLIQFSDDGIIATNEKGGIVIFNHGASKIFGYSRLEAVREMDIEDLYPPKITRDIKQGLYRKKYAPGHIFRWNEVNIKNKDGQAVPVRFSAAILYEKEEVIGSVGFFQDLREIKRLQKELIQSERSAAVGQTVAGLTHGIKNILNGLKGGVYIVNSAFGKMFQEGHKDVDEAGQDYLDRKLKTGWDMVERNIKRVSDLVLDLLSYSKEREPEYENYDPNIIANEVCELMQEKAKENNIEIVCGPGKDIGKVYLDPKGIHGSLLNLVSNAIDACIFDPDTEKDWQVQINVRQEEEGKVVFEVIDNGCGMDKEVRDRIFTEFFSTKGSRGTGLGLLVTQKIIHEHGGIINVDSQPGKGTRFTIRLPKNKPVNKK